MSRDMSIEVVESDRYKDRKRMRFKNSSARMLIDTDSPDFAWQCFLLSGMLCWMVAALILVL
jgi:hypothetical protein